MNNKQNNLPKLFNRYVFPKLQILKFGILFLFLLTSNFFAQAFVEIPTSLIGVQTPALEWGDYDNDGDLDLVVTGLSSPTRYFRIYRNDSGTLNQVLDLTGYTQGDAKWGDYDNDGDLDLVVSGWTGSYSAAIYRNDGSDKFVNISATITGNYAGSLNWVDTDNDGDLDLFISGGISGGQISKLYRNDGSDTFVEISTTIMAVMNSSSDWGDYDNDGDMDLQLSGDNGTNAISKIYRNDGNNTFSDMPTTLLALKNSSSAWGDYDNDGDLDLVISGKKDNNSAATKVYRNISGTLSEVASITAASDGSIIWGDYDNDGDLDLYLSGEGNSKIFRNNGNDTFSDIPESSFTAIESSTSAWGDYDNDGDLDLVVSGFDGTNNNITKLYRNESSTANTAPNAPSNLSASLSGTTITFSWDKATDAETAQNGLTYNIRIGTTSGASDIYSGMANTTTGYRKIVEKGNAGHNDSLAINNFEAGNYFWSVQTIDAGYKGSSFATESSYFFEGFTELKLATPLIGLAESSLAWGDYDNDGDLDLVVAGINGTTKYCRIYRNDSGNFIQAKDFSGIEIGSVNWGDYDNDGDLDLVVVGSYTAIIYRNDGSDTFTDISASLYGVSEGSSNWVDTDNDGDLDLFISGNYAVNHPTSKLYLNEGSDTFSEISTPFSQLWSSASDWGDYDNDGDMDLLLTGLANGVSFSKIYSNDGNNGFTVSSAVLTGIYYGSAKWGDYDNDGDLDIILSGANQVTKIYRNDGNDLFTEINSGIIDLGYSSVDWGDYDNDGDLDIFISGSELQSDNSLLYLSKIYSNNGNDTFTEISSGITGVHRGDSEWGDYDNDGDLDLIITGSNRWSKYTKIYENRRSATNTAPSAPTNLATSVNDNAITFSWDKATDTETSQNGLTYNLVVGTTDGGSDVFSGMVNTTNGYRRIVTQGNTGHTNSWTLNGLSNGQTYYWKVQTIDNTFEGSTFASGSSAQALPVELVSFNAFVNGKDVILEWETATEINNYGFEIERQASSSTTPGQEGYTKIGFVEGAGNSNSPKEYSFTDKSQQIGKIEYRLKQIDTDGQFEYSDIVEVNIAAPSKFELSQNYPNPFNPSTVIKYSIPATSKGAQQTTLIIYNGLGEEVVTLVNEVKHAGVYEVNFDARRLTSGIYYYTLSSNSFRKTKKMILIK